MKGLGGSIIYMKYNNQKSTIHDSSICHINDKFSLGKKPLSLDLSEERIAAK
jgi:hypothetical protein